MFHACSWCSGLAPWTWEKHTKLSWVTLLRCICCTFFGRSCPALAGLLGGPNFRWTPPSSGAAGAAGCEALRRKGVERGRLGLSGSSNSGRQSGGPSLPGRWKKYDHLQPQPPAAKCAEAILISSNYSCQTDDIINWNADWNKVSECPSMLLQSSPHLPIYLQPTSLRSSVDPPAPYWCWARTYPWSRGRPGGRLAAGRRPGNLAIWKMRFFDVFRKWDFNRKLLMINIKEN